MYPVRGGSLNYYKLRSILDNKTLCLKVISENLTIHFQKFSRPHTPFVPLLITPNFAIFSTLVTAMFLTKHPL